MFGIESLLLIEGAKLPTLQILKVYLDKREYALDRAFQVVDILITNQALRQEVIDFISYRSSQNFSTDLRQSQNLRSSFQLARPSNNLSSQSSQKNLKQIKSTSSMSNFINSIQKNLKREHKSGSDLGDDLTDNITSEISTKSGILDFSIDNPSVDQILQQKCFDAQFTKVTTALDLVTLIFLKS